MNSVKIDITQQLF